jgi:TPR repeat protein
MGSPDVRRTSTRWATRIGVVLALAGVSGTGAAADALQDGAAAFARNDTAAAMRLLAPLEQQGDPVAGCMVTVMLDRARGRIAYDAAAMAATCIAAAHRERTAELDLAGDYRTGRVVEQDAAKAAPLYRRAAEQGSPVAQKVLGDLYAQGSGVPRDFAAACAWWGRAAMQGESSEAQRNYGTCYLTGTGVARDETRALAWWLIARNNERQDKDGLPAWVFQSEADADRAAETLTRRLSAAQVAEAQAIARAWQPKAE